MIVQQTIYLQMKKIKNVMIVVKLIQTKKYMDTNIYAMIRLFSLTKICF